MAIQDGNTVSFDYTLTVDGEVVDVSKEGTPLRYVHGESQIIPGLEKELIGMQVGDERIIEVEPGEAYGELNSDAIKEVPNTQLPEGLVPEVGMVLGVTGPGGEQMPVKISKVNTDSVTLDFNHPLAGKTLTFAVKVVSIN